MISFGGCSPGALFSSRSRSRLASSFVRGGFGSLLFFGRPWSTQQSTFLCRSWSWCVACFSSRICVPPALGFPFIESCLLVLQLFSSEFSSPTLLSELCPRSLSEFSSPNLLSEPRSSTRIVSVVRSDAHPDFLSGSEYGNNCWWPGC